ncbi:hypothetical protein DFH09DRAFT_1209034 [Mycena vulgaris]|nr:hypothetical protein DFH09DRAFT_1209034 [Mycena vulgaris]
MSGSSSSVIPSLTHCERKSLTTVWMFWILDPTTGTFCVADPATLKATAANWTAPFVVSMSVSFSSASEFGIGGIDVWGQGRGDPGGRDGNEMGIGVSDNNRRLVSANEAKSVIPSLSAPSEKSLELD